MSKIKNKPIKTLPSVSKFGNRNYMITYEQKGAVNIDGQLCYGVCNHPEQSIVIELGRSPIRTCDTVVHEVLHQMFDSSGIPFKYSRTVNEEEMVVRYLGRAISSHMADNPEFWHSCVKLATSGDDGEVQL